MHILHDWHIDMTHDEVISTCTICGKIKREPWHPILGWCRPPQVPPPKRDYKDKVSVIDNSIYDSLTDTREDGLTEQEGKVMDALVEAWHAFVKLERQHPDERRDFADGIHKCQDLLAVRIARREYPKGWLIK